MVSKLKVSFAAIASIAAVLGVISFTGLGGVNGQAGAQSALTASPIRCFIGVKMDRPDPHMSRGWICLSEPRPVVTN